MMDEVEALARRAVEVRDAIFDESTDLRPLGDLGAFTRKATRAHPSKPFASYGDLYTTHGTIIRYVIRRVGGTGSTLRWAPHGSIVMPTTGETAVDVGKASVNLTGRALFVGEGVSVFEPLAGVSPKLLAYAINSRRCRLERSRLTRGSFIFGISEDSMSSVRVPVVDEERFERACEVVDEVLALTLAVKKKIDGLHS